MVKVNTIVPGIDDQIIDNLPPQVRVVKSVNGNVSGTLSRIDQPNIMNKVPDHLVV